MCRAAMVCLGARGDEWGAAALLAMGVRVCSARASQWVPNRDCQGSQVCIQEVVCLFSQPQRAQTIAGVEGMHAVHIPVLCCIRT